VLSDLESQGYTCWPLVIPACAVDAPHRRDRVWIVAHSVNSRVRGRSYGDQAGMPCEIQAAGPGSPFPNPSGSRLPRRESCKGGEVWDQARWAEPCGRGFASDTYGQGLEEWTRGGEPGKTGRTELANSGGDAANSQRHRLQGSVNQISGKREGGERRRPSDSFSEEWAKWPVESGFCRVAHGVPNRVQRLKALGNSVVPQVVEMIGRAILQAKKTR